MPQVRSRKLADPKRYAGKISVGGGGAVTIPQWTPHKATTAAKLPKPGSFVKSPPTNPSE